MNILIVFGTRPEYLKIKPLCEELSKRGLNFKTFFTGQHKDLVNKTSFNIDVNIEDYLCDSKNRLTSLLSSVTYNIGEYLITHPEITHILVQGDTTSALAGALAAMNSKVSVIHLEAGLRTYDNENPYPEEFNRKLISEIANINLCPTHESENNLISEKVHGKTYVVGNTGLDNLIKYVNECEYDNKILVTLHRRENHIIMDKWFFEINELAKNNQNYEFILPIHPNPNVQKYRNMLTNVKVVDPMEHDQLIKILIKCRLVITDSGGLQEECSFLMKKCLVCRNHTERQEALNISSFLVESPDDLSRIFNQHIDDYIVSDICPFGDGMSSKKIVDILDKF